MASLINCQPVDSYTAEEFPGDSVGNGLLEIQTPPTGFQNIYSGGAPGTLGTFYLVVKPLPGYRIDRTMISIAGGSFNESTQEADGYSNNITTLFVNSNSEVYQDFAWIRIYDSLGDNWESCDNNVIVEMTIVDFEMPNNNYTVSVDLEGQALICDPQPVPDETGTTILNYQTDFYITNFSLLEDYTFFFAQYYDSESYASSYFNAHNNENYINSNVAQSNVWPPYDWNGNFQQNNFPNNYTDGCLNSFQPTCYTFYRDNFYFDGFQNDPTAAAPNTLSTLCGQIIATTPLNGMQFNPAYGPVNEFHPNDNIPVCGNNKSTYKFKVSPDPNNTRYLSLEDYPSIEPGGPVLPSSLSWYISIGENPNYNLIASSEFINIWRILSWVNNDNDYYLLGDPAYQYTPSLTPSSNIDCNFGSIVTSVSDQSENNSDLDFNNITFTQIDDKTVKVTIPFKSGLSISRYGPQDSYQFNRRNKIFANIYPTLI